MPNLDTHQQCTICAEWKLRTTFVDELCADCNKAMNDADIEDVGDESDADIRAAVRDFQKRKEYMREYNERPDVKARRADYMKRRNENQRKLIERAKRLGLI